MSDPIENKPSSAKTYSGLVSKTPKPNQVFVFGSNQNGAHGGGNAKFAAEYWGAKNGEPEGLQGQAYGIVTTIKQPDPSKPGEYINTPSAKTEIVKQIQKLYAYAKAHPEKDFLIGYTEKGGLDGSGKSDEPMLSGYSPIDLAVLFSEAGATIGGIPSNIIFNDKFAELMHSDKNKLDNPKESQPIQTINFIAKVEELAKHNDHLGAVASVFVGDKLLSTVANKIVDKVVISRTPPKGIEPRGAVDISPKNYVIKPYMQIRSDKTTDAETTLHELLHSYTHPYLYAGFEQLSGRIEITNPAQKQRAINHFITISKLYKKAKDAGYKVVNGASIEESISEFVANLTNDSSVVELKKLGLYEPMMAELKKHKEGIKTLEIPFSLPQTLKIAGTKIPRIGIGTFELGGSDKNNVESYVASAINNGFRNIDTAQGYNNLKQVGNAINKSTIDRKEFFVTSKIRPKTDTKTSASVLEAIQKQVQETNLGYIDLMLVHARDPTLTKEDMKQVLLGFKEAKRRGFIKQIGVSNFDVEQLTRARTIIPYITCNQIECHPYSIPHDIIDYCRTNNIVVTAYSPFGSDSKGGKSKDDAKQAVQNITTNPIIKEVATHYPTKTLHQVVLRYLLQLGVMAIPASSNPQNQKSNLDIFDFFITDEDMAKLATINKGKDGSIYTEYYKNKGILK